ncbi:KAP family P-loop NTPase fold protein [Pseudoxanthomonas mexicana]|uniref:KAP family P-loop NTPase fold protein n=1 Tax=Pseudoxanthomonas mexicana TaxID=128785 RepID=UPI0028A9721A|nr:P-loop NTPase fold protein [Pseudoxanthomonas mexicana]
MSQKPGNVQAAFGHDSPVYYRNEDFYDRWPVATAISRVIASSPLGWSTRIGLYGPWGDGKTSVLNLLERQQKEANNIVIRFSPWGASTEDEIWNGFTKALRRGLKRARTKLPLRDQALYFIRRNASWLGKALSALGKASNADVPGASAGSDFAAGLIQKHLKPSRKDAQAMAEVLSGRRVIVLIDDLDRTDPKVIPKLLLALRDLLDFSRFTFVLAFDHGVVSRAITSHNSAWHNAESFLDKIIDFPFDLPPPTQAQVERLARDQFFKLCPFVPTSALDSVISLFPSNPRRLKLLGRVVASTKVEAGRHAVDEINWPIAIIFAMLRLECSPLASELLEMSIDIESRNASWLHWALLEKEERERKTEEASTDLIEKHGQKHNRARLGHLIKAWRDAIPSISGEGLRYQAMFTITPQSITWGEFRDFLAEWRTDKRSESLASFVSKRAKASSQPESSVSSELSEAIISYYSTLLERAAQVQARDAHLELVREAADVLDMARQGLIDRSLPDLLRDSLFASWVRLRSIVMQWLHFNANLEEPELRAKEALFLADFASSLEKPLDVYEAIAPWQHDEPFWGQREANLRTAFSETLQAAVLDATCDQTLELVKTPGQLKQVRDKEKLSLRYLLCHPDSPLFTEDRKRLLVAALEERRDGTYVTEDSLDYLVVLLSALKHEDPICRAEDRRDFVLEHPDFMAILWSLVISRPSQFRSLSALRGYRDILLELGVPRDQLAAPDWLDTPPNQRIDE